MDFWRTVVVLFRRWYITVPAFLATLGMAAAAYSVVPVHYQSGAVLVLTTPLSGGSEATDAKQPNPLTNPLTNFDHSLALAASIVIQQLNSSETALSLGISPGGTTSYQVNNGTTNPELLESGPFIFVQGSGPSPEAAQDIAERVSAMAADVLAQRQTELNAPPSTHISVQVVVPPTAGQPLLDSPLRAAAAAGALAAMASLAAVYGFESLMTHRRRRRHEEERATDAGIGSTAVDTLAQRSTGVDPPDHLHLVHEVASATTRHRVNGTSVLATPSSAIGVLESGPPAEER
jgi:hypothetical protein